MKYYSALKRNGALINATKLMNLEDIMLIKEAVEKRIVQLCGERGIAINNLANISGVAPSTIYSILNEKSKNPGVCSLKKICDGLEISIRTFFDSDLFDDLEQEIK